MKLSLTFVSLVSALTFQVLAQASDETAYMTSSTHHPCVSAIGHCSFRSLPVRLENAKRSHITNLLHHLKHHNKTQEAPIVRGNAADVDAPSADSEDDVPSSPKPSHGHGSSARGHSASGKKGTSISLESDTLSTSESDPDATPNENDDGISSRLSHGRKDTLTPPSHSQEPDQGSAEPMDWKPTPNQGDQAAASRHAEEEVDGSKPAHGHVSGSSASGKKGASTSLESGTSSTSESDPDATPNENEEVDGSKPAQGHVSSSSASGKKGASTSLESGKLSTSESDPDAVTLNENAEGVSSPLSHGKEHASNPSHFQEPDQGTLAEDKKPEPIDWEAAPVAWKPTHFQGDKAERSASKGPERSDSKSGHKEHSSHQQEPKSSPSSPHAGPDADDEFANPQSDAPETLSDTKKPTHPSHNDDSKAENSVGVPSLDDEGDEKHKPSHPKYSLHGAHKSLKRTNSRDSLDPLSESSSDSD